MIRFGMSREANIAGTVADVLEKLENLRDTEKKRKIQISLLKMPYEYRKAEEQRQRQFDIEEAAKERAFKTGLEREKIESEKEIEQLKLKSLEERINKAGQYGLTKAAIEKGYTGAPGLAKKFGLDIGMRDIENLEKAKIDTEKKQQEYYDAQIKLISAKIKDITDPNDKKNATAINTRLTEIAKEIYGLEEKGIDKLSPELKDYYEKLKIQRFNYINELNRILKLPAMEDYIEELEEEDDSSIWNLWGLFGGKNKENLDVITGAAPGLGLTNTGKSVDEMTDEELMQELMK